jgi:tRNA(Ile)-lysidine synthase
MDLLRRLKKTLDQIEALRPGEKLLLAVSGGADSLAMLHLFNHAKQFDLHVLHVHHGIRGAEADEDAVFVEAVCKEWHIPCRIEHVDAPALAATRKISLEAAAREVRYLALKSEAVKIGAKIIAVAHNLDDQAETVLMHIIRGSGLNGLRGMRVSSQMPGADLTLIRPMLGITRAEIEAYCAEQKLTPRVDSTNTDIAYTRNRVRHEIIPALEQVNPQIKRALARLAESIRADVETVNQHAQESWQATTLRAEADAIAFDRKILAAQPIAVQRQLIREAVAKISGPEQEVSFEQVEAAREVALNGDTGALADLPGGLQVRVSYGEAIVECTGQPSSSPNWLLLEAGSNITLKIPSQIELRGWQFSITSAENPESLPSDPWTALIGPGESPAEILLRTRRPGDRFTPQGAGGSQKLGDFMTDHKIPLNLRDQIPLLEIDGKIAWVCGWRVDQRFVVGPESKQVWRVSFSRWSE